jgi:uncharacterized protein YfaT (DUF1175 family)
MSPKVRTRARWSQGECNSLIKGMKTLSYEEAIEAHLVKYPKRTKLSVKVKWADLQRTLKAEKLEKKNGNGHSITGLEIATFSLHEYRIEFVDGTVKIFKR